MAAGGEERMPPPNIATEAQRVASVPGPGLRAVRVLTALQFVTRLPCHVTCHAAPPTSPGPRPRLLNMSAPLCPVACVFQTKLTQQYMHSSNVKQSISHILNNVM